MSRTPRTRILFKLGKRKENDIWYITWSENRRTKRLSTRTTDEAAAKRILEQYVEGWNTPLDEEKTVQNAIDDYLIVKKSEANSKIAIKNYKKTESCLVAIAQHFGFMHINNISRQTVRRYTQMRREHGYSDGTTRKQLSILIAVLNHVRKEGWIDIIPHIDKPSAPPPRDKWMSAEQVKIFLDACNHMPHIKLFSLLALHTLSRKQAILDLTWDRVDMENRLINFNPPDMVRTKKRRVEAPIISDALYKALEDALELAQSDHVIEYNGKAISDMRIGFENVALSANMEWVTPHILRHTGATLLAQAGINMFDIAALMGDNLTTVQKHYAKHSPDHLKNATEKLGELYG